MFTRLRWVDQPKGASAWLGSETLTAASPGLRFLITQGMERLLAASIACATSRTDFPSPLLRLMVRCGGFPPTGSRVRRDALPPVPSHGCCTAPLFHRARPVTAEHLQRWFLANGYHNGEKVVGNATGILTDSTRGMGADGVDITQASSALVCMTASNCHTAALVWP